MTSMKKIAVVSTKTQDLKWEPQLQVVSPFKSLSEENWDECLSLIDEDNLVLLNEIESVIETAKDDHVLFVVLAYVDDTIEGFSLFNAWAGQTKSKSILLQVVKGMKDWDLADGSQRLIASLLVERTMQEALNLKNHDTVKDLTEVYCIGKDTWAQNIIAQFQFTPVPAY